MERRDRAYRPHHIGYQDGDKRRLHHILDIIAGGKTTREEIEQGLKEVNYIKQREKGSKSERYAIEVLFHHPMIKRVRHCSSELDHKGLDLEICPDPRFMEGIDKHYAQIKSSRAYIDNFKTSTKYQQRQGEGLTVAVFNANTLLTPYQVLCNYLQEMQNLIPSLDINPWLEEASRFSYFVDKGH